jgi:uncharacterized protein YdeI (YjbR/CyaY-like superfamily)
MSLQTMKPTFFADQTDFRNWLARSHDKETELLVGFYKVGSGKRSMTWSEAVDQALCFGWIDGVRRRIDELSYSIRFTPRKPKSIWSRINIAKAEQLIADGAFQSAGLAAFQMRTEEKSGIYAYENDPAVLLPAYEKQFRGNKKAWAFFSAQAPSYQRVVIHRIMTAKQEKTRLSRLADAISSSEKQMKIA